MLACVSESEKQHKRSHTETATSGVEYGYFIWRKTPCSFFPSSPFLCLHFSDAKDDAMASSNTRNRFTEKTHEGAPAARMTPLQALRRSVMSCFLWEREFYEDGQEIATRIGDLVAKCDPVDVARVAVECRNVAYLRHVPLLLLCHLAVTSKGTPLMRETVPKVVKRADEITELAALWWKLHPDTHLPHNMEKGLRACWPLFNQYGLAKYDRDNDVKLRDVMRLTHPKPIGKGQSEVYKQVLDRTLPTPDIWEVELSKSTDKKFSWERLLRDNRLGGLALLRNLRNMEQAGVEPGLIQDAILRNEFWYVLPFRFTAAARYVPRYEAALDAALCKSITKLPAFTGRTAVMVDVSGSMDEKLSGKSDLTRKDAAATLASIINAVDLRVFTFANHLMEVPARRGMAGVDVIQKSQSGGTRLFDAVHTINQKVPYDRLICITDEQAFGASHIHNPWNYRAGYELSQLVKSMPDPRPNTRGYMINVASAKNGVGYGKWVHIDGFSENVIRFIQAYESDQ
jgi:60 kDa SS-A/Ro ribonucleoprotein